eukprot:1578466-Rhodomonas_salina.2
MQDLMTYAPEYTHPDQSRVDEFGCRHALTVSFIPTKARIRLDGLNQGNGRPHGRRGRSRAGATRGERGRWLICRSERRRTLFLPLANSHLRFDHRQERAGRAFIGEHRREVGFPRVLSSLGDRSARDTRTPFNF